ncbi:uncharacterized protein JN550_007627 [Neoarthrinium moseri]|uniref:uncharacterized protein n=1 Tax=Neoarthrinium moseri TaxID=1658444 RepID=UPI001FDC16D8|nr:uncharacterized protein JN550_007627 [Neoarthrinium moseri]KAI1866239.1 hypothetical protein JN550_007627 [Neoarthrinium moseri]
MARAMGFSGFGTQPASKRRKYNPRIDEAVTDAAPAPGLPVRHNQGKGANSLPLGVRRANKDEISLDDDDDDAAEDGAPAVVQQDEVRAGGARSSNGNDDEDDPEPQYIDTSRPSLPEVDDVQSKINAIVGSTTDPAQPGPQGPFAGARGGHRPGGRGGEREGHVWYEDYYDPTTNMNPWEKLEKDLGLKPTNSWLTWEESKARWQEIQEKSLQQTPA